MANNKVAGITHNLVMKYGIEGAETEVGLMIPGGDLRLFTQQPYTPFAPQAREGEATIDDFSFVSTWELNNDYSGGVGHLLEGKTEATGYAHAQGQDCSGTTSIGPALYTARKGAMLPPAAEVNAAVGGAQLNIGNFTMFCEFNGAWYGATNDGPGKVYKFSNTGVTVNTDTPIFSSTVPSNTAGTGYITQLYSSGSKLYVCQTLDTNTSNMDAGIYYETTDGTNFTSSTYTAHFLVNCMNDMLYKVSSTTAHKCVLSKVSGTVPTGIDGTSSFNVGLAANRANGIAYFKGAVWIGKQEGLFMWNGISVEKRLNTGDLSGNNNFKYMVVHNNALYFNVGNRLMWCDGSSFLELFPADQNGFDTIYGLWSTFDPLIISAKLKTYAKTLTSSGLLAGTAASEAQSVNPGTDWTNADNAKDDDSDYATCAVSGGGPPGDSTKWLKLTNFSFSVPSNATVTGVVVEVRARSSIATSWLVRKQLYKAGTGLGEDSGSGSITMNFPAVNTDYTFTYGTQDYMWGTTLSPSDVNNSGFGCGIWATGPSGTISVQYIKLNVYYSTAEFSLTSRNYIMMFKGMDMPGLIPLWSDSDGAKPINAVGTVNIYDTTKIRLYFSQTGIGTKYLDLTSRHEPNTYHTKSSLSSYIDLTRFSAGFIVQNKWFYSVVLNVTNPQSTTLAEVWYSIDGSSFQQCVDEDGAAETLTLNTTTVGCYFPIDTSGINLVIRIYLWTTLSTAAAEINQITVRGVVFVKPRYQIAFPVDCSESVQPLQGQVESGDSIRTHIRTAAALGYPIKLQDPWQDWHLVMFRPPSPTDIVKGYETPTGGAPEKLFTVAQMVLMEVDALDSTGGRNVFSVG